jgi:DNA adenine methylase
MLSSSLHLPLNPPLKWAGGKRWLAPGLSSVWDAAKEEHGEAMRWVEPFCGGLALALAFRPKRALLNDANPHLINFYRWLKRGLKITQTFTHSEDAYYEARERFNHLIMAGEYETAEAAQWFYYLNRTGYNGLCRFNREGRFNVPFGRYKHITYATTADFKQYKRAFADWEFQTGDFAALALEPQDFIYADPPYDVDFVAYSAGGFSWHDQIRTGHWLCLHSGPVVASNQATERVMNLYATAGFAVGTIMAPRRISSSGDRSAAREMLAWRNLDASFFENIGDLQREQA